MYNTSNRIILRCRAYVHGEYRECELIGIRDVHDNRPDLPGQPVVDIWQTGAAHPCSVELHQVASIALAYNNGETIQAFGRPTPAVLAELLGQAAVPS